MAPAADNGAAFPSDEEDDDEEADEEEADEKEVEELEEAYRSSRAAGFTRGGRDSCKGCANIATALRNSLKMARK